MKSNELFFNTTITMKPGKNMKDGFTTVNLGTPNYKLALEQHATYVKLLESLGIKVCNFESSGFPDSHFVEDIAGVFPKKENGAIAIIGSPAKEPRKKEVGPIIDIIKKMIPDVIAPDFASKGATLEFGDIIMSGKNVIIGISTRTNEAGAAILTEELHKINPDISITKIKVANVLHADTGLSPLNETTFLHDPALPLPKDFPFEVIDVPKEEGYAAAVLPVSKETVIMAKGFPRSQRIVAEYFDKVLKIDTSEFRKMDGSLRCLKIAWYDDKKQKQS